MNEERVYVDKLDRHDYIKFVENLIENSQNYARTQETSSYVIALDSAWGTGKSYFIRLLVQDVKKQENIQVVEYNAWKNDYCQDAMSPLIFDILSSECFEFDVESENAYKLCCSVLKIIGAFTEDVIENIGLKNTKDEIKEAAKTFSDFLLKKVPEFKDIEERRHAIKDFKESIKRVSSWLNDSNNKLVIIIDELDRCKPTFAIQTLEIVKHLFDIENIVFLFAVDIEQLSHSISSVYGQNFDSVGYLCRFFDYIAKLPKPPVDKYVSFKIGEMELGFGKGDKEQFEEFWCTMIANLNLSLRDIDTIMQSYKLLYDTKLKEYVMIEAHMVYLFYLMLKYKKPDIYKKIFSDSTPERDEVWKMIAKYLDNIPTNEYIDASIYNLNRREKLDLRKMDMYSSGGKEEINVSIAKVVKNAVFFKGYTFESKLFPGDSWGKILFDSDLKKWEDIKGYSYPEYINKQLENYNFTYVGEKAEKKQ